MPQQIPQGVSGISFWTAIKYQGGPVEKSADLKLIARVSPQGDNKITAEKTAVADETDYTRLTGLTFVGGHTVITPEIAIISDGWVFAAKKYQNDENLLAQKLRAFIVHP